MNLDLGIEVGLYSQVKQGFETCVKEITKEDLELQRYILEHERKPLVINQMCREIALMEKKFRHMDLRAQRRNVIAGVTDMFVKAAKAHKEQSNMSEIAKHATPNSAREEMSTILKEVPHSSGTAI